MGRMTPTELLPEATRRLLRTVDSLSDEDYRAGTRLPGWSRAHVVAHLALNAEGLARALEAAGRGEQVAQYDSNEVRAADIDALAAAPAEDLRTRLLAACSRYADASDAMTAEDWLATLRRTTGGRHTWPAHQTPGRRLVEVEVHHADLDAGYDRHDWPSDTAVCLVEVLQRDLARLAPLTLRATDTGHTWDLGGGGPVVSGSAADLAWWLTGREGDGLVAESGRLPAVPAR